MDSLLADLRDDGTLDSGGSFTLALKQAGWKLARYRLVDPHMFAIHMVACAVSAGSTRMDIRYGKNWAAFHSDGTSYSAAQLSLLGQPVLGAGVPRSLQELGIALNAAGGLGGISFSSSAQGGQGVRLLVHDGEVDVGEVDDAPKGQALLFRGTLPARTLEALRERCRFSPISIFLQGDEIRRPVDFGLLEKDLYGLYHCEGQPGLLVRDPKVSTRKFFRLQEQDAAFPTLVLALVAAERARATGLLLIRDGVITRIDSEYLGVSMLCGAVNADHLKRDISETGFVQNAEYEALLEHVRASALVFLEAFCAARSPLPTRAMAAFCCDLSGLRAEGRQSPSMERYLDTGSSPDRKRVRSYQEQALEAGAEASVGNLGPYLALRKERRLEMAEARSRHNGLAALELSLDKEKILHSSAAVDDPSFRQLVAIVDAWRGDEAALEWARAHVAEGTPASRFRAHLILVSFQQDGPLDLAPMDALVEEPEWTAFFHCHEALSDGSWSVERDYGRLTLPLQILALADTGKAVAALDRVWELAGQSSLRPGWLLLGQALTRGRQPMGLWVRLIANLNIRLAGDADITSWRRFWDWKGSLSLNALNRVSDTEWVFRVLDKDFLPLFLAGVAARGQTLLRWHVRRLLALVLLQQSLGGRSDLLESLDCLPARGRFWDDCPPPVAP